jgi:hypothetical protein
MLVLVVIARENFDSGHFELLNFPGRWLLRLAFLAGIKPCDAIMHKVYCIPYKTRTKQARTKQERLSSSARHIYCNGWIDFRSKSVRKKNPTEIQGPVVQSSISANPGLKFKLLFWFVFCMSIYFKTLENKTSIDPDKISRKKHL